MTYSVGIIGTGNPGRSDRYAMAYRHARGYERLDDCRLVGCADIDRENAEAFADAFGIPEADVYEDHRRLLDGVGPDVVSVCTPTPTHADLVGDCAAADAVDAVHCEKPMAATWTECREMVAACDRSDTQLTFNHQRRFAGPYRRAKSLVDDGRIGALRRIEMGGDDLYDYGIHLFDVCGYVTDQTPVEWVIAQVDCREPERLYGLPRETGALARWRYESGVDGLASTGADGMIGCQLRLIGDEGTVEVGPEDGPPLRLRTDGGWKRIDTGRDGIWRPQPHPVDRVLERVPFLPDRAFSDPTYVDRAIAAVVDALREGSEPGIGGANALQATEIVFACWESARRGGPVDLPLEIDDNPLEAMIGGAADPSPGRSEDAA